MYYTIFISNRILFVYGYKPEDRKKYMYLFKEIYFSLAIYEITKSLNFMATSNRGASKCCNGPKHKHPLNPCIVPHKAYMMSQTGSYTLMSSFVIADRNDVM